MVDSKLKRINELANKSKTVGLTPEEKQEQQVLRQEYWTASFWWTSRATAERSPLRAVSKKKHRRVRKSWLGGVFSYQGGTKMKIELTKAEALVLFDWLSRNSKKPELFADQSEQYVFRNMECQLEKELLEIFAPNYDELLKKAQKTVTEQY